MCSDYNDYSLIDDLDSYGKTFYVPTSKIRKLFGTEFEEQVWVNSEQHKNFENFYNELTSPPTQPVT
jgi:hypothetical protein